MPENSDRENLEVASTATDRIHLAGERSFHLRLPPETTILSETTFTPQTALRAEALRTVPPSRVEGVTTGGAGSSAPVGARSFRIVRTTELDPYEDTMPIEDLVALRFSLLRAEAPVGDRFRGTARKAAKLSVANAEIEEFDDLRDLIGTLEAHDFMVNHDPLITTDRNSDRVDEEKRNVRVRAFLYAASRENDNDFHLIIGRDPDEDEMYMNVEISGLPPSDSPFHAILKEARDAYKNFFGDDLPGFSYDFYDPPIPVEIEGSLFFDMSHATGQKPGPARLRDNIPTVWEIHPITSITFEP